jgi:hypothetical protein
MNQIAMATGYIDPGETFIGDPNPLKSIDFTRMCKDFSRCTRSMLHKI